MTYPNAMSRRAVMLFAVLAATLSGAVGGLTLNPVLDGMERLRLDGLFEVLFTFSATAGLAFALCGGAVLRWGMRLRMSAVGVFAFTSILGIAAAVYAAMISYDNSSDSFVVPYLIGSPIGALLVSVPLAHLGRFAKPWACIGMVTALATGWAVVIALGFNADKSLEPLALCALYIGWQAIVLGGFAMMPRREGA